jgi:hypothetical protein
MSEINGLMSPGSIAHDQQHSHDYFSTLLSQRRVLHWGEMVQITILKRPHETPSETGSTQRKFLKKTARGKVVKGKAFEVNLSDGQS